jgi:phage recombination protein Bet
MKKLFSKLFNKKSNQLFIDSKINVVSDLTKTTEVGKDVYKTDTGNIKLNPVLVKKYLVRGNSDNITEQEIMLFIALCKHQKLNPWINEAYLIKYGTQSATMVVGKDVFTKRAFKNPNCNGWKAGITVYNQHKKELIDREGTVYVEGIEKLIGGWCEVSFKDKKESLKQSVNYNEYVGLKKDGTPNKMWTEKPATMIRKVAIVQTLREAFPEDFQNCYFEEEMKVNTDEFKTLEKEIQEQEKEAS